MRFLFAFLALGLGAVSAVPTNSQRIVGGDVTTINYHPSIAALLHSFDMVNFWQSCGSTIINDRHVLTAAHCLDNEEPISWRVRVGSTFANSGGAVHNAELFTRHPNYHSQGLDYDVAIIRTATRIIFLPNLVQRGFFAGLNYNLGDNEIVWAVGWGLTSGGGRPSEQLRHVQIWTVNQEICRQRYRNYVSDNMLCSGWLDVGGRDQCQQDSGSPLYHNGVVVGVCAFGMECGDPYYPGVNMRVSRFINWINANA